ncbi:MAG: lactate utilization protein [Syntrophobacteraceae bacterium]
MLSSRFKEKAEAVSAIITQVSSFEEALDYTVDLCGRKDACRIALSGCEEHLSRPADALCRLKQEKIIAAPALEQNQYEKLQKACAENGFTCLRSGLRSHLSGIDIGFTVADLAIAETGTIVIDCPGEELRLATMLCEYHVCLVARSRIVEDAFAAEARLLEYMSRKAGYTAFITGASRTADIERVLALGVHGPLELHLLLQED